MKRTILTGLMIALSLAMMPLVAGTTARARLDAFAQNLHSLKGHFQQTMIGASGHRGDTTRGIVALQAPRQFRWQTTSPVKQLIVADGSRVWMYEPDLDQVTVHPQNEAAAHSPLTVLTDIDRLDKDFTVTELGTRDGLEWLRLTPKTEHRGFNSAELGFDAGGLRAMVFKDQLDNVTRMRFSDWQRNVKLPASTFNFTPPKGADVIGDTSSVPQVNALQQ